MQLFLRWTCGLGVAHIRQSMLRTPRLVRLEIAAFCNFFIFAG